MKTPGKRDFGISEFLQAGMLITLLGIAFGIGKVYMKIEMKIEDHDTRIAKIEEKVFP